MSNLDQAPADWLADLFEHEYCTECGGDASEHTAVPFMGSWFARCDYPNTGGARRWMREKALAADPLTVAPLGADTGDRDPMDPWGFR